jgi:LDH2 family malate/lactate/ureidoglycolate dehydrogenase
MMDLDRQIRALSIGGTVAVDQLIALAADILRAARVPAGAAERAAAVLVDSQLRGIDSHGLAHLPVYVRRIAAGAIAPDAVPRVIRSSGATAVIDGCNALGVLVALAALEEACRRAKATGVGVCAVRDSNHFGAAAPLVEKGAREGLIVLALSNAAPTMAPWGGREPLLGTNPLAAAFPRAGREPVVIDMATSAASRGRIRDAAKRKEPIPDTWALDATGRPTTDPTAALAGTVQPLGGAKGYALTLLIELLCTALSGGVPGFEVCNPHDTSPMAARTSHLLLAFDPEHFAGLQIAQCVTATMAHRIETATPVAQERPRVPGARGVATAARRNRDGIPLTEPLVTHLRDAVGALGNIAKTMNPGSGD